MTGGPIQVLEDGTRIYKGGMRYKPVPLEQRKNRVLKPDDPNAYRWGSTWYTLPTLLPDEQRILPETIPDTEAYDHWAKPKPCRCLVCKRPEATRWKKKAAVDYRLRWGVERQFPRPRSRRTRRRPRDAGTPA